MAENTAITVDIPQTTVHSQDAGGASPLGGLPFIIIMVCIFYFVLIRPQNKERKTHEEMVASLVKGQRVVTKSGVHGRISAVGDTTIDLEVSDKVKVTVDKVFVGRVQGGE
jgi:preprotein translocase subunit YajC